MRFHSNTRQRLAVWTTGFGLSLAVVACGETNFGSNNASPAPQPVRLAETSPVSKGDANGIDANSKGAISVDQPTGGTQDGVDSASGKPDGKTGTSSDSASGNTGSGGDSSGFKPTDVITDFGTLEKCKMQIFQQTHDFGLCMKCFQQWKAGGNKITAAACGCINKPGDLGRLSANGTPQQSSASVSTSPSP